MEGKTLQMPVISAYPHTSTTEHLYYNKSKYPPRYQRVLPVRHLHVPHPEDSTTD
jgi:hypothetical protein